MTADVHTKPLQASLFRKFRTRILNHEPNSQECVETTDSDRKSTTTTEVVQPTTKSILKKQTKYSNNRGFLQPKYSLTIALGFLWIKDMYKEILINKLTSLLSKNSLLQLVI